MNLLEEHATAWQAQYGDGDGHSTVPHTEEWRLCLTDGVLTRIERVDQFTQARQELSADEYTWFAASYYALYYAGIRDYANAIATGNLDAAQAYYQGMTQYLGALGQI
jgi:hypothetical protein